MAATSEWFVRAALISDEGMAFTVPVGLYNELLYQKYRTLMVVH